MRLWSVALGVALTAQPFGFAQTPVKIPLVVNCTCNDPVGTLLASSLRDTIARSPRYSLTSIEAIKNDQGKVVDHNFVISIISMDEDDKVNPHGNTTVLSFVFEYNDLMLDQWVQICGKNATDACSEQMLAAIDKDVAEIQNSVQK